MGLWWSRCQADSGGQWGSSGQLRWAVGVVRLTRGWAVGVVTLCEEQTAEATRPSQSPGGPR